MCNLFCSVQEPKSDNEALRIHKPGDKRCTLHQESEHSEISKDNLEQVFECRFCNSLFKTGSELQNHVEVNHEQQVFECPFCNSFYKTGRELQNHVEVNHEQHLSLSLLSHVGSDSWMHVTCPICDVVFENKRHETLPSMDHEYGETCNMYYVRIVGSRDKM